MVVAQGRRSALVGILLLAFLGVLHYAHAVQHVVGEDSGWSIPAIVNVNYSHWAESSKFHVGDTLFFKYDATLHDVEEVSRADYRSCTSGNAKARFDDGSTLITLNRKGRYYFICGFSGHCDAGQKLEVKVLPGTGALAPSPVTSTSPPGGGASTSIPADISDSSSSPGRKNIGVAYVALQWAVLLCVGFVTAELAPTFQI